MFQKIVDDFHCKNIWKLVGIHINTNFQSSLAIGRPMDTVRFSGYVRNTSCIKVPKDLPLPSAEMLLEDCDLREYVSYQIFMVYWKQILLILNKYGLYWFKDETSVEPLGYLNINDIDSISSLSDKSLKIVFSRDNIQNYISLYFKYGESCCNWKTKITNALSQLSEEKESTVSLSQLNLLPLFILDNITYSENDLVEISLSKRETANGSLQIEINFAKSLFKSISYVTFQLSQDSFKCFLVENDEVCHIFMLDSSNGFRLYFTPSEEHHTVVLNSLCKWMGPHCFGGYASIQKLTELFFVTLENVYYKCQMNPKKYLVQLINDALSNGQKLQVLDMQAMTLTTQDLLGLSHGLKFYPYITTINLRKSGMIGTGLKYLLGSLTHYPLLKILDIGWNNITFSGINSLFPSFLKNSKLEEFNCSHVGLEPSVFKTIFKALKDHLFLKKLDLSYNNIDDSVCYAISEVIDLNNVLKEMKLWHSMVTVRGILHLLESYVKNSESQIVIDLSSSSSLSSNNIELFEHGSTIDKDFLRRDLLGVIEPIWVEDAEVDACLHCYETFSFWNRRSHCRACGKVFCKTCLSNKHPLRYMQNTTAAVCLNCLGVLKCD